MQRSNLVTETASQSSEEKRMLTKEQLIALLHAYKCQQREQEQVMKGGTDFQPCSLPQCSTFKKLRNHMTDCKAGLSCTCK